MLPDKTIPVGKATRPRPAKGDLQIQMRGCDASAIVGTHLLFDIDGLKVPFEITWRDCRGGNLFVKLRECGKKGYGWLAGCEIYCREEDIDASANEARHPLAALMGSEVYDSAYGHIGKVTKIDDSTINTVLCVEQNGREALVPLAEEFMENWDRDTRTLRLRLPQGLLDIYFPGN